MIRNIYLIMLFLSLAGFRISSNRNITGTVYSKEDHQPLSHVTVIAEGTNLRTTTDLKGHYALPVPEGIKSLAFSLIGYQRQIKKIGKSNKIDVVLEQSDESLTEVVLTGYGTLSKQMYTSSPQRENQSMSYPLTGKVAGINKADRSRSNQRREEVIIPRPYPGNTESYKTFVENAFLNPGSTPLSTFAIDVDAASYSNVRRMINSGYLPARDAVRIEEMINYFHYDLSAPRNEDPVAIHTELSAAPWNPQHRLMRIGLKAKSVPTEKLPPSNFVFLIDVSGSMAGDNRLPLVKASMKLLIDQLRDQDHVAIVTYAGAAGLHCNCPVLLPDKK